MNFDWQREAVEVSVSDEAGSLLKQLANHYYYQGDRTSCEHVVELLRNHYASRLISLAHATIPAWVQGFGVTSESCEVMLEATPFQTRVDGQRRG